MIDCIEHERYAHETKKTDQSQWTGWCSKTQTMRVCKDECAYCGGPFNSVTNSDKHSQMCRECWDDGKMRGLDYGIVEIYIVD